MAKKIFILNGYPRSGKDTVVNIVEMITHSTTLWSSVDTAKEIYRIAGWNGEKNSETRMILSNIKNYLTEKFDLPFTEACAVIKNCTTDYLFLMIREPDEIRKLIFEFPEIRTVLIDATRRIKPDCPTEADANVGQYKYEIVIDNNGTIDELELEIRKKIIK